MKIDEVIVNGVRYVPAAPGCDNPELLNFEWDFSDAGGRMRIRDYLCKLLSTLWKQREGFHGKRPFGNSSWEYDLYAALIAANAIDGELDEYGDFESLSAAETLKAQELIAALITSMCGNLTTLT